MTREYSTPYLQEKSNLELLSDMPKQGIPAETISAMMDRVAEVNEGTKVEDLDESLAESPSLKRPLAQTRNFRGHY